MKNFHGWLVCNAFVHSEKFEELFAWLEVSAAAHGFRLTRKTNAELLPRLAGGYFAEEWPDFALFWDKDTKLCRLLEAQGIRTFNSARAIELCDDKALTWLALLRAGIRQPKTILVPKVFHEIDWASCDFAKAAAAQLKLPLVVKECFGSFGAQVYLAHTVPELIETLNGLGTRPALLQEFVAASKGHDIRIQVVGGRVVTAMYRYAVDDDFRANVTNGAKMRAYTPNAAQERMALEACRCLGLDFAGVDILFGEKDMPILCEVNSNAHFIHIFHCTGVNTADAIFTYIRRELEAGRNRPASAPRGETET